MKNYYQEGKMYYEPHPMEHDCVAYREAMDHSQKAPPEDPDKKTTRQTVDSYTGEEKVKVEEYW